MKTSSFKISGTDPKAVAISRTIPDWYVGLRCVDLAPPWNMLHLGKTGMIKEFTWRYQNEVLVRLNPREVYETLEDRILVCWEAPGEFCHRRLVAEWIEADVDVVVDEVTVG